MSVPPELVQDFAREYFGKEYREPQAAMIAEAVEGVEDLKAAFERHKGQGALPSANKLLGRGSKRSTEGPQYHRDMEVPEEAMIHAWGFWHEHDCRTIEEEKPWRRRCVVLCLAAEVHCGKRPADLVPDVFKEEVQAVLDDYKAQMEAVRLYCASKYAGSAA